MSDGGIDVRKIPRASDYVGTPPTDTFAAKTDFFISIHIFIYVV